MYESKGTQQKVVNERTNYGTSNHHRLGAEHTCGSLLTLVGRYVPVEGAASDKEFEEVGYPIDLLRAFGFSKIVIAILCLIPATSFVGLILATGWLGGAIAAHVRVKDKFIAPALFVILLWVGFGLRHQSAMHSLFGF